MRNSDQMLVNHSKTYYFENQSKNSANSSSLDQTSTKYKPPWPVAITKKGLDNESAVTTLSTNKTSQNNAMSLDNGQSRKSISASSFPDHFNSSTTLNSSSSSISPNVSSSTSQFEDGSKECYETDEVEDENMNKNSQLLSAESTADFSGDRRASIHLTTIQMLDNVDFNTNLQRSSSFSR